MYPKNVTENSQLCSRRADCRTTASFLLFNVFEPKIRGITSNSFNSKEVIDIKKLLPH